MRRRLKVAIALAALALMGSTFILAVRRSIAGPVYPVAAVQAGLRIDLAPSSFPICPTSPC